ncbi:MAG: hypothetical protein K9I94_03905 [Bacteroidales bacterium]|nr:hypothetical protein [Bacteroidales bacterium]
MNTGHNHIKDPLRKLMQKAKLQKPSDNFTDNIMNQIGHEPVPSTTESPALMNSIRWAGAMLAAAAVIYLIFFFDWSFLSPSFQPEEVSLPQIQQFLTSMTTAFNQIVELLGFFNQSSVGAIAIVSVAGLYLIDRALKKFSYNNGYLL